MYCVSSRDDQTGASSTAPLPPVRSLAEANRAQSVEWGEVRSLRAGNIQNDSRGVANSSVAALDDVAGSKIGGGRRSTSTDARIRPNLRSVPAGLTQRVDARVRLASDGSTTRVSC